MESKSVFFEKTRCCAS